jgi:DNA-binding transcriptional MerR regulator
MPAALRTPATRAATRTVTPTAFPSGQPICGSSAPARYTITELAAEFDITPRAIRFYEDMGLLTPARAGRNRVYAQRDRTRLKLTLRGKRLGLSLLQIKQLVDMYESRSDATQQLQAFLAVLAQHRVLLEQQREDLEITLTEITQHEARCRSLLSVESSGATSGANSVGSSVSPSAPRARRTRATAARA